MFVLIDSLLKFYRYDSIFYILIFNITDTIVAFIFLSSDDMSTELALRVKNRRLAQKLTQEGLANRSGVPFGTLKKFERTGQISLISFIKLVTALGDEGTLEKLLLKPKFDNIDEVLKNKKEPLRGTIK